MWRPGIKISRVRSDDFGKSTLPRSKEGSLRISRFLAKKRTLSDIFISSPVKNRPRIQRSESRSERRSSGMSALWLLKKVGASDMQLAPTWCGHGDSNPNASLHENLNLACLPIPSCPHMSGRVACRYFIPSVFTRRGTEAERKDCSAFIKTGQACFYHRLNAASDETENLPCSDSTQISHVCRFPHRRVLRFQKAQRQM